MARASDCSDEVVADIESGATSPLSLATAQLQRLAAALRIGWDELRQKVQTAASRSPQAAQGFARRVGPERDFAAEMQELLDAGREEPEER